MEGNGFFLATPGDGKWTAGAYPAGVIQNVAVRHALKPNNRGQMNAGG
jgi:hypothetical protein